MSDDAAADRPSGSEEIKADIERTRAELADTVDQVADKLNVKSQVGHKAESIKETASERAAQAKAAAPPTVRHALDTVGEKAGPPAHRANAAVAPYRGKIAAAVAVGAVILLVVRRKRSHA